MPDTDKTMQDSHSNLAGRDLLGLFNQPSAATPSGGGPEDAGTLPVLGGLTGLPSVWSTAGSSATTWDSSAWSTAADKPPGAANANNVPGGGPRSGDPQSAFPQQYPGLQQLAQGPPGFGRPQAELQQNQFPRPSGPPGFGQVLPSHAQGQQQQGGLQGYGPGQQNGMPRGPAPPGFGLSNGNAPPGFGQGFPGALQQQQQQQGLFAQAGLHGAQGEAGRPQMAHQHAMGPGLPPHLRQGPPDQPPNSNGFPLQPNHLGGQLSNGQLSPQVKANGGPHYAPDVVPRHGGGVPGNGYPPDVLQRLQGSNGTIGALEQLQQQLQGMQVTGGLSNGSTGHLQVRKCLSQARTHTHTHTHTHIIRSRVHILLV